MILSTAIQEVNYLIDDSLPPEQITAWINDCLSQIGTATGATFPEVVLTNDIELPIPNKWQRLLVIPFASARAKQQDSSQFEYADLYAQFTSNLDEFVMQYKVPVKYKELKPEQELTFPDLSTYTTVSGDTLYQVALDNSVTVQDIIDNTEEITYECASSEESNVYEEPPYEWWGSEW